MFNALKNGHVLCKVANILVPGSIRKINESKMAFKIMENINNFLLAAESMGCQKLDLFQTVDLYENQNIAQVMLYASEYFNSNFAWSGINETSNIITDLLL